MANEYKYGAYGNLGETVAQSAVQAGTTVVYVGIAPVNLVREYASQDIINNPVKLTNYQNAQRTMGYSQNWEGYSLCEAMDAHFNNKKGNIGPIYLINVLNPDIHRKKEETNVNLVFSNGQAMIKSDTIILDTIALDSLAEDVDYQIDYNYTKGMVIIRSIGNNMLSGAIQASFYEVDLTAVNETDIIGGVTERGEYSGLGSLQLLYQGQNQVCNLLAAPGWSEKPEVYKAMCSAAQQINGHWEAFVLADIPVKDAAGAVDSIAAAKNWKRQYGYTSERSKVFWPQAVSGGIVYHLSTKAAVEFLRTDYTHNSVPMETCGNETADITGQYFGADSKNRGFDQVTGKELTSNGISTCVFWGGNWVIWGDHTAAYEYGADIDARSIFDVSMRMLFYIANDFQREWGQVIDDPFTRQVKDRIINREQEKLDTLVAKGALIGNPQVVFLESENSTTDMMNGDFRWDIDATPTPPLKSATVYVAYTDKGFKTYFETDAE